MHTLPALPAVVRTLLPHENERVEALGVSLPATPANCHTCLGRKSFLWWDKANSPGRQPVEYECPCVDQYLLQRFLLNSGLDKLWARYFWSDTAGVETSAAKFVGEYVADLQYLLGRGIGLFLCGSVGNGKSLLAALIAKRALRTGHEVYFTTFDSLLTAYTKGWRDVADQHWFETTVRNVNLLVVDDMGKEWPARDDMVQPAVDAIFRARIQSQLATIITTNFDRDAFKVKYGLAVSELVSEGGYTWQFTSPSWRDGDDSPHSKRLALERSLRLIRPFTFG